MLLCLTSSDARGSIWALLEPDRLVKVAELDMRLRASSSFFI